MADDDPFDPGIGADQQFSDPGTEAEGKARDLEAELLERRETPESRLAERVDELSSVDAGSEVAVPFWAAVIFANVGVLLVALGPMVAYFLERPLLGAALTVAGGFALWRTYATYRRFKQREREDAEADDPGEETASTESTTDATADDRA